MAAGLTDCRPILEFREMDRALPQSSPIRDALVLEVLLLPLWYLALPLVPMAFSGGYAGSVWLANGLLLAFYVYPLGILLNDPMVEIVAVCDVYDALISPRPYRQASYDNRTALEEITVMAEEGVISWEVVQVLVAHNRKSKPHYTDCIVSKEKRGKPPYGNVYGIIVPDTNGSLDEI